MKDPKQIGSPWEPWWTYRAPQSFAITEKLDDNSKLGTNLNLFKDEPAEEHKTEEKEDNAFEDDQEGDSEESEEDDGLTDDIRR